MQSKDAILQEIDQIPESLLDDILMFIRSLKAQSLQREIETCLLSEAVLAQDWLSFEEEEAWKDL